MRPVNCLMMGFAVIVGAALASGFGFPPGAWWSLLLSFFTAFTLTGSAMAVNDYYDRGVDAVNEPQRPIPSGAVSPREALLLFAVLSLLGFAFAFLTNLICLATALFAWAVMTLYSTRGKRTGLPGNLLVSTCVSLPFIYGALALGGGLPSFSLLFASMAFLSNTGREVTKGIVDIEGDAKEGIKTVAVSYGARAAAVAAAFLNSMAVLLSFLPVLWQLVSLWYLPFVIASDVGFIASSLWLLKDRGRENARRIKNLALLWMALALVGFLAGILKG
jgi:geranylgeranylglycerol-phosphate geranylgeranyltransferase